jgi:hypothetical protein
MRDLELEQRHNQAIRQEIGECLRAILSRAAVDIPPRLRDLVGRLDGDQASSPNVQGRKSIIDWLYRR